jgi:hypothetical protein
MLEQVGGPSIPKSKLQNPKSNKGSVVRHLPVCVSVVGADADV